MDQSENYAVRPVMSMAATALIATGVSLLVTQNFNGIYLLITGCALYLFKAVLYKHGYFNVELKFDDKKEE